MTDNGAIRPVMMAVVIGIALTNAPQAQTDSLALPLLDMDVRQVFSAVAFHEPLFLTHAGDGSDRIFVVERSGIIKVFPNRDDVDEAKVFLDISEQTNDEKGEMGLLGLAFHPQYADNGQFYVYYTRGALGELISRLSEYRVAVDDRDRADPASERVIMEVEQPSENHNGGSIAFGPDGLLYWGLGDGSPRLDSFHTAQNLESVLGAIVRIDVDGSTGGLPYAIPSDNPLTGNENGWREELWAWGLRNPWRFSFDRTTGTLWVGDVGQDLWEEVDIVEKGGNYGWSIIEGLHCFSPKEDCDEEGLIPPVVEFGRELGSSVIGGYVYRGPRLLRLQGTYVYGDFGSRNIWGLRYAEGRVQEHAQIARSPSNISSFGEDEAGEVYVVNVIANSIYVLDEKPGNEPTGVSESGEVLPFTFVLEQSYPNPFNSGTTIAFELAEDIGVRLEIFDLLGRRVATLIDEFRRAGQHRATWDGTDLEGIPAASGTYLYRLSGGGLAQARKMVLLR